MPLVHPASFWDIKSAWKREDGKLVQTRTQDVEGYLERNVREQNERTHDRGAKQWIRKGVSIPNNVYIELMRKLDIPTVRWFRLTDEDMKRLFRLLNSSEYTKLKTTNGKL
jgi:hypothetical protein